MSRSRQAGLAELAAPAPVERLLAQVQAELRRTVEVTVAQAGLTVDQWRVLDVLAGLDAGCSMSEIAAVAAVPGPTLTKIVDRLVESALVCRLVDNQDRRRVLAFCSEQGRHLHGRFAPLVAHTEASTLARLGADATPFRDLLARLAAAGRDLRGEVPQLRARRAGSTPADVPTRRSGGGGPEVHDVVTLAGHAGNTPAVHSIATHRG